MAETPKIYSVSELNSIVRDMLESRLGTVSIEGEISNFSHVSSGHMYFSLKDHGSQLSCAMFKGSNSRLRFVPANGRQVIAHGKLSLYVPNGRYQLIINRMEAAGEGALQAKFIELKQMLADQGVFDQALKKPLPKFPTRLGVITSPTGAAIQDILNVLQRRYPIMEVKIYPVAVQGETSAKQIVSAIAQANLDNDCDVLLLSRGGGSIEDLWSFNEEIVAHAIRSSNIPIISGVGHEIDETIADYAADVRAPTPSAAAEIITPDGKELLHHFYAIEQALTELAQRKIDQHHQTLDFLAQRLEQQHPQNVLRSQQETLAGLLRRLHQSQSYALRQQKDRLQSMTNSLRHLQPLHKIAQLREQCVHVRERLQTLQREHLLEASQRLTLASEGLNSINPNATLKRGYAIISDSKGGIIDSIKKSKIDAKVHIQLQDGVLQSKVDKIVRKSSK